MLYAIMFYHGSVYMHASESKSNAKFPFFHFISSFKEPQFSSVMLIDSGEMLKASALQKCTLLKLSKKAQSLPACAIPCKVAKVMSFTIRFFTFDFKQNNRILYHTDLRF